MPKSTDQGDARERTTASQATEQRTILEGLQALRRGDFGVRLALPAGPARETVEAFNDVAELCERTSHALRRMSRIVGRHGQMGVRASIPGATGGWARNFEELNTLADQLTEPAIQKLGARNRAEAVRLADQKGWLEPGVDA